MSPRRRTGGSRFGCLLLFFAAALVWGGGQDLYTALRNRKPTSLTLEEYARAKPDAEWLELRDVVPYLLGAAHIYKYDSTAAAREIYVPLYAAEPEDERQPTPVVLKTSDAELVRLYNEAGKLTTDAQAAEWYQQNQARLASVRRVRGVVQFGINLEDHDRDLIRAHVAHQDDFVVLAEGERPSLVKGFALLAGGIGILAFGAVMVAKRS